MFPKLPQLGSGRPDHIAAYELYSAIFDRGPPQEIKRELNDLLRRLQREEINVGDFSEKIQPLTEEYVSGVQKLAIDNPNNFPFHLACVLYSRIFDKNPPNHVKKELNELISKLARNKSNLENFYISIDAIRRRYAPETYGNRGIGPTRFATQASRRKRQPRR